MKHKNHHINITYGGCWWCSKVLVETGVNCMYDTSSFCCELEPIVELSIWSSWWWLSCGWVLAAWMATVCGGGGKRLPMFQLASRAIALNGRATLTMDGRSPYRAINNCSDTRRSSSCWCTIRLCSSSCLRWSWSWMWVCVVVITTLEWSSSGVGWKCLRYCF